MPIYEYQCQSCGHELEALQKMSDPLLTDCPACKEASLKKKISAAGFRLKGSGWYETDFKTGKKKNVAGDSSASGSSASSGSQSSSGSSGGEKTSPAKKTTSSSSSAPAS
ncbi:FmdB family zinc ribbon protein [Aurantivibrio plasticivorans]